jgi:hypothetical protein
MDYPQGASIDGVNTPSDMDYFPSEKAKEVVADVVQLFRDTADERNRAYNFFDGRNLIEYIEDSVLRYTTNVDNREGLEDWQARIHDPFTRNKVTAVLGKVVSVLPIASFTPRGDEDNRKASILTDLYSYSEEKADYEEFMTHFLLEAIVKGTAIGYEGMQYDERMVRDVSGIGDDITIKERQIKEVKLFSDIVPLEEFYPSSVSVRTIKDMPYCFWRSEMSFSEFKSKWSYYKNSKYVQPANTPIEHEQRPYFVDYITSGTQPGNVEIIRYYNCYDDCYVVIANGVWLNPIYGKEEMVSPIPFNHKRLPFFEVKFDFLGNWFYGKSLPDKLHTMQDVLNVLSNMLLDQSFLTIFPPLLTNGFDSIEDDYLRPGRRTPIDTQGLPINNAFMKLDLGTPAGWHQYILEYTRKIMEESSMDKVSQGVAGVGGRTTAQEIRMAAEGVAAVLGLFGRMINYGLKQKAALRGKNILQFWTDPKSPALVGVLGENADQSFKDAFNMFKIDNTVLTSGKRGTRVLAMYEDPSKAPDQATFKVKSAVAKVRQKRDIEYMAIDASYIRNMEFDVKIVMDQKREQTRDIEKALQLEKVRVYAGLFPPGTFDMAELAAQTAEKMGDDPTKILSKQTLDAAMQVSQPGEAAKPVSPTPTANVSKNMTDAGAGGLDGGLQQLTQLAGGMTG